MENNNSGAPAPSTAMTPIPDTAQPQQTRDTSVSLDEAEEAVETAATPAEKQQAAKTLRKLKIKYNQKEYDEELPFEIPDTPEAREYMTRQLQMGRLGQGKAQEKAQLEKDVFQFIDDLKKNPRAVLNDPNLGVDLKKLAAEILQEEIENSSKSPEQLEAEKLKRELKELRDERENEKKAAKDREFELATQQSLAQYRAEIKDALKDSSIPDSPYVTKKIADYLSEAFSAGLNVSVKDVLPLVEEEIQADIQNMFSSMPEDAIQKIIGKDKLNNLRKKSLAKGKTIPQPLKAAIKDTGGKPVTKDKKEETKLNYKQFFGV